MNLKVWLQIKMGSSHARVADFPSTPPPKKWSLIMTNMSGCPVSLVAGVLARDRHKDREQKNKGKNTH